jgi:hypothetical protein
MLVGKMMGYVPGTYRVPGTGYWVLGTGYWVLGTGYWVPGTGYRVPGTRIHPAPWRAADLARPAIQEASSSNEHFP